MLQQSSTVPTASEIAWLHARTSEKHRGLKTIQCLTVVLLYQETTPLVAISGSTASPRRPCVPLDSSRQHKLARRRSHLSPPPPNLHQSVGIRNFLTAAVLTTRQYRLQNCLSLSGLDKATVVTPLYRGWEP